MAAQEMIARLKKYEPSNPNLTPGIKEWFLNKVIKFYSSQFKCKNGKARLERLSMRKKTYNNVGKVLLLKEQNIHVLEAL